jgi:hypothetical protein
MTFLWNGLTDLYAQKNDKEMHPNSEGLFRKLEDDWLNC